MIHVNAHDIPTLDPHDFLELQILGFLEARALANRQTGPKNQGCILKTEVFSSSMFYDPIFLLRPFHNYFFN